jgi:hypothetical protein
MFVFSLLKTLSGVISVNTDSFLLNFLCTYAAITVQVLRSVTQDRKGEFIAPSRFGRHEWREHCACTVGVWSSVISLVVSDSEANVLVYHSEEYTAMFRVKLADVLKLLLIILCSAKVYVRFKNVTLTEKILFYENM